MSKMGNGYGSEFHLLRWPGRHRDALNQKVLATVAREKATIKWLDFRFGHGEMLDLE